jgi:hypothetical protein
MKEISENEMLEEAKWEPQLVLELRDREPKDPLLHWVAIWFAAKMLLEDTDEHPDHWEIKYDMLTEEEVCKIRDEADKQWRSYWVSRNSSPNIDKIISTLKRFVGYKSFDPPEGL